MADARIRLADEAGAAESQGDVAAFAEAAIGLGGLWVHEHRSTLERHRIHATQRRALAALEPTAPQAIRLRARLAAEAVYCGSDVAPLRAEREAACRSGDAVAVAEVSWLLYHCLLGPHFERERRALIDELVRAAASTDRPRDCAMALLWRAVDLHLAGHRRAARALAELDEHLAERRCDAVGYAARAIAVASTMRSGALARAEQLATSCLASGLEVGDADAPAWYAAQLLALRWMQGRLAELRPLVARLTESVSVPERNDVFTAAMAVVAIEAGDAVAARAALASLRASGLARLAPSSSYLTTMLAVSEAAYALEDRETAAEVAALLAPFADLPVMASLGVACFGSAHRPLGLALWTAGDVEGAIAHLEAAIFADQALGNRPAHAVSLATLAEALATRGRPADHAAAVTAWRGAIEGAEQMGMSVRAARWAEACRRAPAPCAAPAGPGRRPGAAKTCRVALGGRDATVPATVGIRYLVELMANPGREIRAVDLVGGASCTAEPSRAAALLDPVAKAAYRERISDLRAELDDAESAADIERAAIVRSQLDQLVAHLAQAAGLGGRSRVFADEAERARVAVRKALTRALAAVHGEDPVLAAAIEARLVTGARCIFHADPAGPAAISP
ncbi:MAG: hypothetical protein AB7O92_04715 [Acidimicrobiia bacterium]